MGERPKVNGLPLPRVFTQLLAEARWRHPGDDTIRAAVPFIHEPVDFLPLDAMRRESRGALADFPQTAGIFHEARSSRSAEPVELPWLDVERAVFIAVNRFPGDDLGIALDYRTGLDDPQVVASDWHAGVVGCIWRPVANSFTEFARALGITPDAEPGVALGPT